MKQSELASRTDYRYRNDPAFHAFVDVCVMLTTPVTTSPGITGAIRESSTEAVSIALILLEDEMVLEDGLLSAVQKATGVNEPLAVNPVGGGPSESGL